MAYPHQQLFFTGLWSLADLGWAWLIPTRLALPLDFGRSNVGGAALFHGFLTCLWGRRASLGPSFS